MGAWLEWQVSGEAAYGQKVIQLTKDLKARRPVDGYFDARNGRAGGDAGGADAQVALITGMGGDGAPCYCSRLVVDIVYGRRTDVRLERGGGDGIHASPGLDLDRVNRIVLQFGLIA